MFKLVIFAEEVVAKRATINSSSVSPDATLALNANCVYQGTFASMDL